MVVPDYMANTFRRWRLSSIDFAKDLFGFEPDIWQRKFFIAFSDQNVPKMRQALQACAGPGKTAVLAISALNFMSCYGDIGEHPKGAALSVTGDNLYDNLWPEIAKWRNKSELMQRIFELNNDALFARDHPGTWFLSARTFSKTADPEEQGRTLSGLHAKYVLILIDESGDIPIQVLKTGEQAFASSTCAFGRIVQAGNPTSLSGMLYAAAGELADQWNLIRITGDPDDPDRSPRIDIEWAKKQIETWGRFDPWVMSYILGKFPPSSINQLIGPDEVAEAMKRILKEEDYIMVQKRLGVDVARFGDDKTIIFPRQGLAAFRFKELRKADSFEIAGAIEVSKANFGSEAEYVDDTGGWSAGVQDEMIRRGKPLIPINMSKGAQDPRYYNKRSECIFRMCQWAKRGALPMDTELKKELCAYTYTMDGGKLRVVEKEKLKAILKHSPDKSDSLSLTFADVDVPASVSAMIQARHDPSPLRTMHETRRNARAESDVITEYDPHAPERW